MAHFFVLPKGPRPDFRLVIAFLWDDFQNVDTEGNSQNPASREWTSLYCQNRENKDEVFQVSPEQNAPLLLKVESKLEWLAARVAYFLAVETNAGVSVDSDGPFGRPEAIVGKMGARFNWQGAVQRAAASCWRQVTLENPYPNRRL